MEEFVKVEELVKVTGASFEDARNALRACDWDMVDSMIYLEKLGKVTAYKTNNSVDPRFAPISDAEIAAAEARRYQVTETKADRKAAKKAAKKEEKLARKEEKIARSERRRGTFGEFIRKIFRFLTHNKITISKEGQTFASIPLLAALIICSISFGFAIVCIFVSMMFGYEYSFTGESELESANRVYAQTGTTAVDIKAEYDRL